MNENVRALHRQTLIEEMDRQLAEAADDAVRRAVAARADRERQCRIEIAERSIPCVSPRGDAAAARAGRTQAPFGQTLIEEMDRQLSEALREPPEPGNLFDRQAPEQIRERHVATLAAAEATLTENRQPRNIRLRDHHER